MKVIEIEIKTCNQCPKFRQGNLLGSRTLECSESNSVLRPGEDYSIIPIPDWCSLPNKEED